MTAPSCHDIARYCDELLRTAEVPEYSQAINGLQLQNTAPITGIAAAVDFGLPAIRGAIAQGANLLLVHHGMFWSGVQPFRGPAYERLSLLMTHDIAVYASHLPLDAHATLGNNVLLAQQLLLEPSGGFADYKNTAIGVRGESEIATEKLVARADLFARIHGGRAIATRHDAGRMTRRWGMCTGAGASADTIAEAEAAGIDTLIVGEGPHWTAVDAMDRDLVIIYAGHYATETLGVNALGEHLGAHFALPYSFIAAPTGL